MALQIAAAEIEIRSNMRERQLAKWGRLEMVITL